MHDNLEALKENSCPFFAFPFFSIFLFFSFLLGHLLFLSVSVFLLLPECFSRYSLLSSVFLINHHRSFSFPSSCPRPPFPLFSVLYYSLSFSLSTFHPLFCPSPLPTSLPFHLSPLPVLRHSLSPLSLSTLSPSLSPLLATTRFCREISSYWNLFFLDFIFFMNTKIIRASIMVALSD